MVKCVIGKAGEAKQDSDALSNTPGADIIARSVGSMNTSAESISNSQNLHHYLLVKCLGNK
jgi:hypothetical protein